jgi:Tfp pilus assembly protein PilF
MRASEGLFDRGDVTAAAEYFGEAARKAPPNFEHGLELAHLLGRLAAAHDDDERAEEALEIAFEGEPENARFALSLAEFHARRGRPNRAYDVATEGLVRNPDDERLGALHAQLGERGAVNENVVNADDLAIADLVAHAEDALQDGGDAEGAEWILRQAERRAPEDPDVQLGLADALLASESPEAHEQIRRAATLAGGDPLRLTRVASHMLFIGDVPATRRLVDEAWRLAGEDLDLIALLEYTTGLVAGAEGDAATAERLLESAFRREPGHPEFGRSLASFHKRHGGEIRAREVVEEALRHRPDDAELLSMRADVQARTRKRKRLRGEGP